MVAFYWQQVRLAVYELSEERVKRYFTADSLRGMQCEFVDTIGSFIEVNIDQIFHKENAVRLGTVFVKDGDTAAPLQLNFVNLDCINHGVRLEPVDLSQWRHDVRYVLFT